MLIAFKLPHSCRESCSKFQLNSSPGTFGSRMAACLAGVQFLFRQYSRGIGGILADDMGLGKTVQAIAFCAALLGKTGTEKDSIPQQSVDGKRSFSPTLRGALKSSKLVLSIKFALVQSFAARHLYRCWCNACCMSTAEMQIS